MTPPALPPNGSLARVRAGNTTRWSLVEEDAVTLLRPDVSLAVLLATPLADLPQLVDDTLETQSTDVAPDWCAPVDDTTEVWAAGVTYEQSRQARVSESTEPDIYERVYTADRPELFFKAVGWRVRGTTQQIGIRKDSDWNVPEPELAAVLRPDRSIFAWTICNDVSSRSIEGENPLYLPQAKIYEGSCAIGPALVPDATGIDPYSLTIAMSIGRGGSEAWTGTTTTAQLRRRIDELSQHLFACQKFPHGVVISTGTSLVPDPPFTLQPDDTVTIQISGLGQLVNTVTTSPVDSNK